MSDPHNRPDRRKSPRIYVNLQAYLKTLEARSALKATKTSRR